MRGSTFSRHVVYSTWEGLAQIGAFLQSRCHGIRCMFSDSSGESRSNPKSESLPCPCHAMQSGCTLVALHHGSHCLKDGLMVSGENISQAPVTGISVYPLYLSKSSPAQELDGRHQPTKQSTPTPKQQVATSLPKTPTTIVCKVN